MNKIELQYNGDFSNVVSINNLKDQMIINALCFTNTVDEAALEVGITKRTIFSFMSDNNIDHEQLKVMRVKFQISGKKVKRRFEL